MLTFKEAVYDGEGNIERIGISPAFPTGLSVEEIKEDIQEFVKALKRVVIDEENIQIQPEAFDAEEDGVMH